MDPEQVLIDAERAQNQGDLPGAERILAQAWPNMQDAPPDARHLLGVIRAQQGDFAAAEQLLLSATRTEPDSLRHHIALGHVLVAQEKPAEAAEAYAAAMRIDRDWPGLSTVYARACFRAGRYDEAEKAARHAIAAAPSVSAYTTLAAALREQGKANEALAAADEALRLAPDDAGAIHSRAAALLKAGRAEEALRLIDGLVAQGVDAPAIHLNRGKALLALKREREARDAFAEGVRRHPADPDLQAAARR